MKRIKLICLVAFLFIANAYSQDLPENPQPGKCYVRCTTPDIYVNEEVKVQIKTSYSILKTIPAKFEKKVVKVKVKDEEVKLKVVPAKWEKREISYAKKEGYTVLTSNQAKFINDTKTVEIKPEYAQWELGTLNPDCESSNPDDCKYWCFKGYPAEFKTIEIEKIDKKASVTSKEIKPKDASYFRKVIKEKAKIIEEVIPAEYSTVTQIVKVEDAKTIKETIPSQYKTIIKEVLKEKGGLTSWKEVDCNLVEYQALPINWNLNSYILTSDAKNIINNKLLPILANNPGAKLEIASHTDSRGSEESNQLLSEKRAQAVVNYLQQMGINTSLLVANGYGEKRLKNRCSNGVSCTEKEHSLNRRTEFRLIDN